MLMVFVFVISVRRKDLDLCVDFPVISPFRLFAGRMYLEGKRVRGREYLEQEGQGTFVLIDRLLPKDLDRMLRDILIERYGDSLSKEYAARRRRVCAHPELGHMLVVGIHETGKCRDAVERSPDVRLNGVFQY